MQSPMRNPLPSIHAARGILLVLLALGVWSCGGDDDGGTGPEEEGGDGFRAKVDGQSWVPEPLSIAALGGGGPGAFVITGTQNVGGESLTINLLLSNITGTGTFPLGTSTFMYGGRAQLSQSGAVWATPNDGTSGTITLTTLQPGRIAGTFEYRAEASNSEATGTRFVTEGDFDLPMTGPIVPVPDHIGHRVTATIGGEEYIAGTVSAGGAPGVIFDSSTEKWSVAIRLDGVDTADTYTLSEAMPWRFVTLHGPCDGISGEECNWRAVGIDDGTVTVTSITATRAKGTFSVTVRPEDGEPASDVIITDGTFDIGIQ